MCGLTSWPNHLTIIIVNYVCGLQSSLKSIQSLISLSVHQAFDSYCKCCKLILCRYTFCFVLRSSFSLLSFSLFSRNMQTARAPTPTWSCAWDRTLSSAPRGGRRWCATMTTPLLMNWYITFSAVLTPLTYALHEENEWHSAECTYLPRGPRIKPHLNSLDPDFHFDLRPITKTHNYQTPECGWDEMGSPRI